MSVGLQPWHRDLGDHVVSGSLYAVPRALRLEAARALDEARCRVHVDVVLGPDGHQGVGWAELYAVREALPGAVIDLHLIVLHGRPGDDEALAVRAAQELRLATLATAAPVIRRNRAGLDAVRARGTALFEQVTPGTPGTGEPHDHLDGALVMLVTPGTTREPADADALTTVETLARTLPVGVDGGVTPEIARRCRDLGAELVVSGRHLFVEAPVEPRLAGQGPGSNPSTNPVTKPRTERTERRSA